MPQISRFWTPLPAQQRATDDVQNGGDARLSRMPVT
jgi:hypothetical protein